MQDILKYGIVLLDSDITYLELFEVLLRKRYRVFIAQTAEQVWEIIKNKTISILIADETADSGKGVNLLHNTIADYPHFARILTGTGVTSEKLVAGINDGLIFHYLVKPWKPEEIESTMENAVAYSLARQKKRKQEDENVQYILHKMNFLHEISQKLSEKKPLNSLLDEILLSGRSVMNAESSSFMLFNPEDQKLRFHVLGGKYEDIIKQFPLELGKGIAGWVAKNQQPALIKDCYNDPRFNPEYDKISNFHTRSMICVPLVRKNILFGVLSVINRTSGGDFEERDLQILETLASQCAIAIENTRLIMQQVKSEALNHELETAREIQQVLLPSKLPQFKDIDLAARVIPAMMVGGDYYNIISINSVQTLLFISDVSGKSISAALIVSTIHACLNTYLRAAINELELKKLVENMNRVLMESVTPDKFATCWFGLYNHSTKILTSINAGHNFPIVFHKGNPEPEYLKEGGIFLGSFEEEYSPEFLKIESGDTLVFFTDGVTEATNINKKLFTDERLLNSISKNLLTPAQVILESIFVDIKEFVGEAEQSDDITCVVAKF